MPKTISKASNTRTTEDVWIATSFLLTSTAMKPCLAALCDIFGRPACLFASLVSFTISSVLRSVGRHIAVLLQVGNAHSGLRAVGGVLFITTHPCGLTVLLDVRTRASVWVSNTTVLGIGIAFTLVSRDLAMQPICVTHEEGVHAALCCPVQSFETALGFGIGSSDSRIAGKQS